MMSVTKDANPAIGLSASDEGLLVNSLDASEHTSGNTKHEAIDVFLHVGHVLAKFPTHLWWLLYHEPRLFLTNVILRGHRSTFLSVGTRETTKSYLRCLTVYFC